MLNPYQPPFVSPESLTRAPLLPKRWWLLPLVILGGGAVALAMTYGVSLLLVLAFWALLKILLPFAAE